MLKKLFQIASLAALLTVGFALGANQSLSVFAASNPKPQRPQPAPNPTPAPQTPGPLAPNDPIPCLPGNPCGIK
jgi:hypothetical protein